MSLAPLRTPPDVAVTISLADPASRPEVGLRNAAASGQLALPTPQGQRLRELTRGIRAALPLAVSLVPFLVVFGVLARTAGLSLLATLALAICVFSGFQLVAVQMLLAGAPGVLIVVAGAVMNTRHLLYSAQLAPSLRRLSLSWRLLLAYLLTDEVWALLLQRCRQTRQAEGQHWFGLGAGLTIWVAAQGATLAGALLGSRLPTSWHLELAAPFTFLSLLVLSRPNRAGLCAALAAGLTAWLAAPVPLGLGLLLATGVGLFVGTWVERLTGQRREVRR